MTGFTDSPRYQHYIFLVILFFTETARGALFLTFLPLYLTKELGFNIALAGLAVSAHYLSETIGKPLAGSQYDAKGKPILILGLLLGACALICLYVFSYPVIIIFACAALGIGVSPLWPGIITEVAPVHADNRTTKVGMVFSTWLAGTGFGMVGINFLLFLGYQTCFLLIIATFIIAFMGAIIMLPPSRAAQHSTSSQEGMVQGVWKTLCKLAETPAVTRLLLPGMFLQTLSAGLLLPILPLFAESALQLNHDQYGLLLLAGGGATVLFLIPMGKLADKVGLKLLLTTGFLCTAVALGLLAIMGNQHNAFYLAMLVGLSYAAVLPAWNSLQAKCIPVERQATSWGIFATAEGLGVALGPALGGLVARGLGTNSTIFIATLLLISMFFFYLFYPVEKQIKNI